MNINYSKVNEIENQILQLYKSLEKKVEELNLSLSEQKEEYENKIGGLEKQLELNAELFKNLNINIEKLTKENGLLKEHSAPIKEYLAVMKLNEKLIFELLDKNYSAINEEKNYEIEENDFCNENVSTNEYDFNSISTEKWDEISGFYIKNNFDRLYSSRRKLFLKSIKEISECKNNNKVPKEMDLIRFKEIISFYSEKKL